VHTSSAPSPDAPTASTPTAPTVGAVVGGAVVGGAVVRVRGLPGAMSDAEVRELFGSSGRILSVALERGAYSAGAQPKEATITFDARASAELAVKTMDGTKLRQATLAVELM